MLLLQRLRAWLARRQKPPQISESATSEKVQKDIGVRVTRIRLPSGREVKIVDRERQGE